jgi:large subunit ribosomal protein L24
VLKTLKVVSLKKKLLYIFQILLLIDPKSKKATRVRIKVEGDKKVRFSKKSNQVL